MKASREFAGVAYTAEQLKCRNMSLFPLYVHSRIETLGTWVSLQKAHKIGARVCENTGDHRATSFLVQRLAIDM